MTELAGNRFTASVSKSGKVVDINDRRLRGFLLLLTLQDVQDMRDHIERIFLEAQGHPFERFALEHPKQGSRSKILAINEEDARELLELMGKLEEIMVPS